MSNYWGFFSASFSVFAFAAYLMILFYILPDLFRDRKMNGWLKALWIVLLVALPYVASVAYLIARGRGMADRQPTTASTRSAPDNTDPRWSVDSGASSEIEHAKDLFDAGTITADEFAQLKTKAIAGS